MANSSNSMTFLSDDKNGNKNMDVITYKSTKT